jgi:tetratricopeptide (TPR) repeat protein
MLSKANKYPLRLLIISVILFLYLPRGIAQPSLAPEYISGFRIISYDLLLKRTEDDNVSSKYYSKIDSLFEAKEYEKVTEGVKYALENVNITSVEPFYYGYTSCLHLKKYNEALAIAEKGIVIISNLGFRKNTSEYNETHEPDRYVVESILYAGKFKALIALKENDEAKNCFLKIQAHYSYYQSVTDIRDFYIPIRLDMARYYMDRGFHKGSIELVEKLIDLLNYIKIQTEGLKYIDEIEKLIYSAICEINYLNNTPGSIAEKAKKGAIRDFSEYSHLITLYNEGKYQQYVTEFTKIDDGKFSILYKYLGFAYNKLGQKQESCKALKKYRNSQNNRIPKVEPEVDEVETAVCN